MRHDGHVRVRSSTGAENVCVDATGRCIRRTSMYRRHSGTFVLRVNGACLVAKNQSIGETKKKKIPIVSCGEAVRIDDLCA